MEADQIIIGPIVTEKTNLFREKNKYVFQVDSRANKIQVMQAARALFQVHPVDCRIINVKGKPKRVRYRQGYTSGWKKAIITLPEGEAIQAFEGT